MTEYNFNEKIEYLLQKQRRTKKSLYNALGMSMQGFDSMMKNNSFTAVRIGDIAKFFGIHISELYGDNEESPKNERLSDGSDDYLREHVAKLEESFTKLSEQFATQLSIKDQQMAGLQRTIDALVGKSEGATDNPLSFDEFKLKMMYHYYTQSAYKNLIAPSVRTLRLATHD